MLASYRASAQLPKYTIFSVNAKRLLSTSYSTQAQVQNGASYGWTPAATPKFLENPSFIVVLANHIFNLYRFDTPRLNLVLYFMCMFKNYLCCMYIRLPKVKILHLTLALVDC